MLSVTKITKEYFEIESGDRIYFITPLEKTPSLKEFQLRYMVEEARKIKR